ncbi:uncharacterized protein LACBIDRAFT_331066 [Laccaria bicolor S238N-H82]|uniref:Predicted protein n=1 Tax=Laccaria bicolor (strain S238N-H82 / ATCC MYA-4686) TaxID=486041 RepID=B0DNC0_LACBS|nr:uncharacterized protein LACBIDRAFT_331066 [Laccaria bicolor S238N-H82]EDR03914.1 predicted protein [Laccaria bicolor S238N-H82]|eukprot:XP_001885482.1 predicted protein [Laccaria bicolor S238N-H82]
MRLMQINPFQRAHANVGVLERLFSPICCRSCSRTASLFTLCADFFHRPICARSPLPSSRCSPRYYFSYRRFANFLPTNKRLTTQGAENLCFRIQALQQSQQQQQRNLRAAALLSSLSFDSGSPLSSALSTGGEDLPIPGLVCDTQLHPTFEFTLPLQEPHNFREVSAWSRVRLTMTSPKMPPASYARGSLKLNRLLLLKMQISNDNGPVELMGAGRHHALFPVERRGFTRIQSLNTVNTSLRILVSRLFSAAELVCNRSLDYNSFTAGVNTSPLASASAISGRRGAIKCSQHNTGARGEEWKLNGEVQAAERKFAGKWQKTSTSGGFGKQSRPVPFQRGGFEKCKQ